MFVTKRSSPRPLVFALGLLVSLAGLAPGAMDKAGVPTPGQPPHDPASGRPVGPLSSIPYLTSLSGGLLSALGLDLPDLRVFEPYDVRLDVSARRGRRVIRFSTAFWNSGSGLLELLGRPQPDEETIRVLQNIYNQQGQPALEVGIGAFVWHPLHNHYHMDNFMLYALHAVDERGTLLEPAGEGQKVSFCVTDIFAVDERRSGEQFPSEQAFPHCNGRVQGLTPGWADVYRHSYPDQWVEVTDLPDGRYALVFTINPDLLVQEENLENNRAFFYLELDGNRIRPLSFE